MCNDTYKHNDLFKQNVFTKPKKPVIHFIETNDFDQKNALNFDLHLL